MTGSSVLTASATHERMAKGADALADYVRTGSLWQITVTGRDATASHTRVTQIPSMSEALRMAIMVADRMFPSGAGLLHDRVASELACPVGRVGRMSLCRSLIRKSSARMSSVSRGTAARA